MLYKLKGEFTQSKGGFAIFFFSANVFRRLDRQRTASCATQSATAKTLKSPAGGSFPPLGWAATVHAPLLDEFGLTLKILRSAARKMLSCKNRSSHFASPRLPGRLQRLLLRWFSIWFDSWDVTTPVPLWISDESLGGSSTAAEQQFSSAGIRAASLLCKHRLNSAARTSL